jgi:two-component system cell cycle response regulator DivK
METTDAGTIVLLDDNLLSSLGLMTALKRRGYDVVLLSDARDAPARAVAAAPRAIVVNLAALAWDANALVRDLKAEPALAGVPVVGFAGHQEVERIAAARQAGCDYVAANSAITADPATVLRHLFERAERAKE